MPLKDRNTVPPGGWQYRVPETGTLLTGATIAAVARAASEHLQANGIMQSPHELAGKVENQICANHPHVCFQRGHAATAPKRAHTPGHKWSMTEIKNGIDAFVRFLKPDHFVTRQQSFTRASVCASCPLNIDSAACSACSSGLLYMVKRKLDSGRVSDMDRQFTGSRKLKLCDACGCFIQAKVHLKIAAVMATMSPDQLERISKEAPGCWILKENKTS